MVEAIFTGNVTAQRVAGEVVTLTVTKPDASTEMFDTVTLADKTYTISKTYDLAGDYTAKAHGDADGVYTSWDSAVVPFTITLTPRTGTLVVTIA